MRKRFAKIKPYLSALAGALYAWFILGNVVGEIFVYIGDGFNAGCYPYASIGGISTLCEDYYSKMFWRYAVGFPSLGITILTIAIGFFRISIVQLDIYRFLEALWWSFVSTPILLLIIIPGFYFWRKIAPNVAWGTLLLLIGHIFYNSNIR